MSWKFYRSKLSPTGLSEPVGGGIDFNNEVHGDISNVFTPIDYTGSAVTQYRLIFVKNEFPITEAELTAATVNLGAVLGGGAVSHHHNPIRTLDIEPFVETKAWISALENVGQIRLGLDSNTGLTIASATGTAPQGVTFVDASGLANALTLTGLNTDPAGIWICQIISGQNYTKEYATIHIGVQGYRETEAVADLNKGFWEPPFNFANARTASSYRSGAYSQAIHLSLIPVGPERGSVITQQTMRDQTLFLGQISIIMNPYVSNDANEKYKDASIDPFTSNPLLGPLGTFYCGSQQWMYDGKLLMCGGEFSSGPEIVGMHHAYLWDPTFKGPDGIYSGWTKLPNMRAARWYPTITPISSGKFMVAGGLGSSFAVANRTGNEFVWAFLDNSIAVPDIGINTYEIFDYSGYTTGGSNAAWVSNSAGRLYPGPSGVNDPLDSSLWIYPRLHVMTGGKVVMSGPTARMSRKDNPLVSGAWTGMYTFPHFPTVRDDFGAVDLPNATGYIGIFGGYFNYVNALGDCYYFNGNAAGPGNPPTGWDAIPLPSMPNVRRGHNTVLLPDGKILIVGGDTNLNEDFSHILGLHPTQATRTTLSYSTGSYVGPANAYSGWASGTWTPLDKMLSDRVYHSTACLLPDGRVLSAGGDARQYDYQIYRPPYLMTNKIRPDITSTTDPMRLGNSYSATFRPIPASLNISIREVVFIPPAGVTHSLDMMARRVPVTPTSQTSSSVTFTLPSNQHVMPWGYYMMFLVTNEGIPSEAAWIRIGM